MATQDLFIHQSVPSQGSSFVIMSEDERKKKKQESELLALAAVLKQLEEDVVEAKNGATTATQTPQENSKIVSLQTPNATSSSDTSPFQKAMAEMVLALQILQVEIAKFAKNKADFDQIFAQGEIKDLQNTLKDIEDKMQQMAAKEAKQATLNNWILAAEIVAAVVVTAVALVFGQVEIAALVIAMTVASATHGFQKLTDLIAKGLVAAGMNKDVAQIVAAVLVVVAVIIATFLLAPAAAPEAVDTAAQTAAEVAAEEGGEAVEMSEMDAESIGNVTTDSTQAITKARSLGMRILDGLRNVRGNLIVSNALQALSQTQVTDNIANLWAASEHLSDEKKQQLEIYLNIAMQVVTLIVTIFSAAAISSKMSSVSRTFSNSTKLGQMMIRLRSLLETAKGMIAVEGVRQSVSAIADGLEAWAAILQIQQGTLQIGLSKDQAQTIMDQMAMNKNNEVVAASQQHAAQMEKAINTGNQSITKLIAGEAGFATLFTQYAPV